MCGGSHVQFQHLRVKTGSQHEPVVNLDFIVSSKTPYNKSKALFQST